MYFGDTESENKTLFTENKTLFSKKKRKIRGSGRNQGNVAKKDEIW